MGRGLGTGLRRLLLFCFVLGVGMKDCFCGALEAFLGVSFRCVLLGFAKGGMGISRIGYLLIAVRGVFIFCQERDRLGRGRAGLLLVESRACVYVCVPGDGGSIKSRSDQTDDYERKIIIQPSSLSNSRNVSICLKSTNMQKTNSIYALLFPSIQRMLNPPRALPTARYTPLTTPPPALSPHPLPLSTHSIAPHLATHLPTRNASLPIHPRLHIAALNTITLPRPSLGQHVADIPVQVDPLEGLLAHGAGTVDDAAAGGGAAETGEGLRHGPFGGGVEEG